MPAEIIASGSGAVSSADVTVVAGTPLTVALKTGDGSPVPYGAQIHIEIKDDDDDYVMIGTLAGDADRSTVIIGPGVYRFSRPASSAACGLFSA